MRASLFAAMLLVTVGASRPARADLANNELIHEHVGDLLRGVPSLDPAQSQSLLANRLTLNLGALVPVFGTYELDRKVFGSVRPAAVVFDWVLGGLVPAGLGLTALVTADDLSARTRAILGGTALGLYALTRAGVLLVGNLHISEFNHEVQLRLGLAGSQRGELGPAFAAIARW